METQVSPPRLPAQPISGPAESAAPLPVRKRRGFFFYAGWTLLFLAVAGLAGLGAAAWWYHHNFHASPFRPVVLSQEQQESVDLKIEALNSPGSKLPPGMLDPAGEERIERSTPGAPSAETGDRARRTLVFTETEINGVLHHNSDLGEYLDIDLDRDRISARAIVPFPADVPFIGGKTLRLRLSLGAFLDEANRLAIIVQDVSVGGVPLPAAWLGGLKGANVVEEYSSEHGLLKALADGIEEFDLQDGKMTVILKP
ncbi:MAG TPA: hypothetical protein VMN36_07205 [Verrucomicrobiales bacterium]|nr:hypothetical protein [Verrucomicrobiales bacterium]